MPLDQTTIEEFKSLARQIETSEVKLELQFDPDNFCGETIGTIILRGGKWEGHRVLYFEDCGDMDYIEKVISPDGTLLAEYEDLAAARYDENEYGYSCVHTLLDNAIERAIRPADALRDLALREYRGRVARGEQPPPKPFNETLVDLFFQPSSFLSYLKSKGVIK